MIKDESCARMFLSQKYGDHYDQATVSFVGMDPIKILRFVNDQYVAFCVPDIVYQEDEAYSALVNPNSFSMTHNSQSINMRILICKFYAQLCYGEKFKGLARSLAILAASPMMDGLRYESQAIISLNSTLWEDIPYTCVLIGECELSPVPLSTVTYEIVPVIPITSQEADIVRQEGAEQLYALWNNRGIDYHHPRRAVVV